MLSYRTKTATKTDMQILAQRRAAGPIGGKSGLNAKLYPNGECVVYKPKTFKMAPLADEPEYNPWALGPFLMALWGHFPPAVLAQLTALGLSPHRNSDKLIERALASGQYPPPTKKRYGTKGITSYGARRVRNACYLLENSAPKKSTVFATCTVPALPIEEMAALHERWNEVVEVYRRKLRRRLRDQNLRADSVTVSEIQSKRYQDTSIPVLHIHTVFVGRRRDGKPAITTKEHDLMWGDALRHGLRGPIPPLTSACNMQWVNKSAEGYLGKYMTKGSKVVKRLVAEGFEGWLPKQWWSISSTLGRRIDEETRQIDELAEWLNDVAEEEGSNVWLWHRNVSIEMRSGDSITIAKYGRLSIRQNAEIHAYYSPP